MGVVVFFKGGQRAAVRAASSARLGAMEAAGVGRADAVRTLDLRDERQVLVGQFVLDEVAGYVVGDEADGQLLSEAAFSAQAQRSPDVRLDGTPGGPWRHI